MNESMWNAQEFVTVAMAFDDQSEGLYSMGVELARRMKKKLCLVHVEEPWTYVPSMASLSYGNPYWDALQNLERSASSRAQSGMAKFVERTPSDVKVVSRIVTGRAVPELISAATDVGTCLLLAGIKFDHHIPLGLSTVLPLLFGAPFPVMVIDTTRVRKDLFDKPKLLVADDLSDRVGDAVGYAALLAEACRGSHLQHVHVSAFDRKNLQTALATAAATARTDLSAVESDKIYEGLRNELLNKLEDRVSTQREYIEAAGSTYASEVAPGPVKSTLDELIKRSDPDILIFGRHEAIHSKPFSLGRMPYRAMLKSHRPVIIVPSAQES